MDWARRLLRVSIRGLDSALLAHGDGPGQVLAVPHLSGATAPWHTTREPRGALFGLSLATSSIDIVKALLEGIVFDIALSLDLLRGLGLGVERLRAAGGGTLLAWWMQLYADLCGVPIEVAGPAEPGTLGAALLAGVAAGAWASLEEAAECAIAVRRRYDPDPQRAARYKERLAAYRSSVAALVQRDARI